MRVVRLDTGQGQPSIHIPRTGETRPVELGEEEFKEAIAKEVRQKKPSVNPEKAARELFDVPPRSGWYGYTQREGVAPLDGQPPVPQWAEVDVRVTQEYLRFCEAIGKPGDCRGVLMNSPVLTGDGRYALAMSFAIDAVLPEMMEAFKDMADPETIKASILWTMTLYAAMWLAPEPVFSKGLATVVTASFICYIGVDTFWTLIQGWRRLVERANLVTSFSELREAGKTYGKVMGKNAARAFALLLTAAIGQTASSFSAKVSTLLGSSGSGGRNSGGNPPDGGGTGRGSGRVHRCDHHDPRAQRGERDSAGPSRCGIQSGGRGGARAPHRHRQVGQSDAQRWSVVTPLQGPLRACASAATRVLTPRNTTRRSLID
jgi:hypothetical protein